MAESCSRMKTRYHRIRKTLHHLSEAATSNGDRGVLGWPFRKVGGQHGLVMTLRVKPAGGNAASSPRWRWRWAAEMLGCRTSDFRCQSTSTRWAGLGRHRERGT